MSSKLDYCNSLYSGLPSASLSRLQSVQNSLARLVFPSVKRSDHITPTLKKLHWLPIPQRITFKIALLTFKALSCHQPSYLCELIVPYQPTRHLRSADQRLLTVPDIKSSLGRRSFSFSAPSIWNSLPLSLRSCDSVSSFRKQLKTHLFPPWIFFLPAPTWILNLHRFLTFFLSWKHLILPARVDPAGSIVSAWGAFPTLPLGGEMEEKLAYALILCLVYVK